MSDNDSDYDDYTQSEDSEEEDEVSPAEALKLKEKAKQEADAKAKRIADNLQKVKDKQAEREAEKEAKLQAIKDRADARRAEKKAPPVKADSWETPPSPPYEPTINYDYETPNPYGETQYDIVNPYEEDSSFMEELAFKRAIVEEKYEVQLTAELEDFYDNPPIPDPAIPYVPTLDDAPEPYEDIDINAPFRSVKGVSDEAIEEERRQINELYNQTARNQLLSDFNQMEDMKRYDAYSELPAKVIMGRNKITLLKDDANPAFLASLEEAVANDAYWEEDRIEQERLKEEARIKGIFYKATTSPPYPWTLEQTRRWGTPDQIQEYEEAEVASAIYHKRIKEEGVIFDKQTNVDRMFAMFGVDGESESDDDLEEVPQPQRQEPLLDLKEPLPWEENPKVWEAYNAQMARKIEEQKAELATLQLATPLPEPEPVKEEPEPEPEPELPLVESTPSGEERERIRELIENAPSIRPDLESTELMGQQKRKPKGNYRNAKPLSLKAQEAKEKKAEARKEANRKQRQKDYDEDKETYFTDKKEFIRKTKVKRRNEELAKRDTKPKPRPRSPSPEPREGVIKEKKLEKVVVRTQEVKERVKERVKKKKRKKLEPVRPAPKRPTPAPRPKPKPKPTPTPKPRPLPKTPDPTPTPRPRPKPRPASIPTPTKAKRATRSDKGTHHKWSDGRESSSTYKKNKAKGVDWSAVRCRASTCWEVGDRSKDAKGGGAYGKNKSSGEYKKQLREKPKKKKKDEKREEDGWF